MVEGTPGSALEGLVFWKVKVVKVKGQIYVSGTYYMYGKFSICSDALCTSYVDKKYIEKTKGKSQRM